MLRYYQGDFAYPYVALWCDRTWTRSMLWDNRFAQLISNGMIHYNPRQLKLWLVMVRSCCSVLYSTGAIMTVQAFIWSQILVIYWSCDYPRTWSQIEFIVYYSVMFRYNFLVSMLTCAWFEEIDLPHCGLPSRFMFRWSLQPRCCLSFTMDYKPLLPTEKWSEFVKQEKNTMLCLIMSHNVEVYFVRKRRLFKSLGEW